MRARTGGWISEPAWLAVIGSILCLGCSNNEHYRRGRELSAAGDHERAVLMFREAVKAEPGNSRFQVELAEAEMAAAQKHLDQAERLLADNQATPARIEVNAARDYVSSHPKVIRLGIEIDERIERGRALAGEASSAMQERRWADAYRLAVEAAKADAGGEEVRLVLAEARTAARANGVAVDEEPVAVAGTVRSPTSGEPVAEGRPKERDSSLRGQSGGGRRSREGEGRRREDRAEETMTMLPSTLPTSFRGTLSRDDDRYPKKMETIDGIVVKLEDTDADPLNADVTIRVGRYELTRKHIRIGVPVYGRGVSGRSYRLVIEGIAPRSETIRFLVEPVSPTRAYAHP